jgi:hypothetical protein
VLRRSASLDREMLRCPALDVAPAPHRTRSESVEGRREVGASRISLRRPLRNFADRRDFGEASEIVGCHRPEAYGVGVTERFHVGVEFVPGKRYHDEETFL